MSFKNRTLFWKKKNIELQNKIKKLDNEIKNSENDTEKLRKNFIDTITSYMLNDLYDTNEYYLDKILKISLEEYLMTTDKVKKEAINLKNVYNIYNINTLKNVICDFFIEIDKINYDTKNTKTHTTYKILIFKQYFELLNSNKCNENNLTNILSYIVSACQEIFTQHNQQIYSNKTYTKDIVKKTTNKVKNLFNIFINTFENLDVFLNINSIVNEIQPDMTFIKKIEFYNNDIFKNNNFVKLTEEYNAQIQAIYDINLAKLKKNIEKPDSELFPELFPKELLKEDKTTLQNNNTSDTQEEIVFSFLENNQPNLEEILFPNVDNEIDKYISEVIATKYSKNSTHSKLIINIMQNQNEEANNQLKENLKQNLKQNIQSNYNIKLLEHMRTLLEKESKIIDLKNTIKNLNENTITKIKTLKMHKIIIIPADQIQFYKQEITLEKLKETKSQELQQEFLNIPIKYQNSLNEIIGLNQDFSNYIETKDTLSEATLNQEKFNSDLFDKNFTEAIKLLKQQIQRHIQEFQKSNYISIIETSMQFFKVLNSQQKTQLEDNDFNQDTIDKIINDILEKYKESQEGQEQFKNQENNIMQYNNLTNVEDELKKVIYEDLLYKEFILMSRTHITNLILTEKNQNIKYNALINGIENLKKINEIFQIKSNEELLKDYLKSNKSKSEYFLQYTNQSYETYHNLYQIEQKLYEIVAIVANDKKSQNITNIEKLLENTKKYPIFYEKNKIILSILKKYQEHPENLHNDVYKVINMLNDHVYYKVYYQNNVVYQHKTKIIDNFITAWNEIKNFSTEQQNKLLKILENNLVKSQSYVPTNKYQEYTLEN